jgi:hypothetical protein
MEQTQLRWLQSTLHTKPEPKNPRVKAPKLNTFEREQKRRLNKEKGLRDTEPQVPMTSDGIDEMLRRATQDKLDAPDELSPLEYFISTLQGL